MNFFKELQIHSKVVERLQKSIINNRLAHAYLFYGPEGTGKEAVALELAKALNCRDENSRPCGTCPSCNKISKLSHPDIKFIFPTAKSWSNDDIRQRLNLKSENPYSRIELSGHTVIQIERIRELKNESKYSPYEGTKKVYIMSDADKMSRECSNSFLKLLEEPPETLLIILITSSINSLLDTIRSRCQLIHFPILSSEEALTIVGKFIEINDDTKRITQLSQGNLKNIFEILQQDIGEKRQFVYNYLRASASGNALMIMEIVDQLNKKRDKNFLKDILDLLILWFKDAIHLATFGENTKIINIDFEDEIKKFASSYRNSDFGNIISMIEQSIFNLKRNVYNPLILTVLSMRIKRNLVKYN